jgi:RHS repeat-associated protein
MAAAIMVLLAAMSPTPCHGDDGYLTLVNPSPCGITVNFRQLCYIWWLPSFGVDCCPPNSGKACDGVEVNAGQSTTIHYGCDPYPLMALEVYGPGCTLLPTANPFSPFDKTLYVGCGGGFGPGDPRDPGCPPGTPEGCCGAASGQGPTAGVGASSGSGTAGPSGPVAPGGGAGGAAGPGDASDGCGDCMGAPVWSVSLPYVSVWLRDQPLPAYYPAIGPPVALKLSYKQREAVSGFYTNVFSFGKRFNFSWFSYVTLDISGNNVVHLPGGGTYTLAGTNDYYSNIQLSGDTNSGYTVSYPDGSKDVYGLVVTNSAGNFLSAFLTERRNPASQMTTLYYNPWTASSSPIIRLACVVDGNGGTNTVSYVTSNGYSTNLISQVTDPFGRSCTMLYDTSGGHCTNITDSAGLPSSFIWDNNDWITNMATPYGVTSFAIVDASIANAPNGRSVLVTQPDGGHHLFLCTNGAPGIANSYGSGDVPNVSPYGNTFDNSNLSQRNTFRWGPRQYANLSTTTISSFTASDFRLAAMKHWLTSDGVNPDATLSLSRDPSPDAAGSIDGQKTWYDYAGKTNNAYQGTQVLPLVVARVLPDGSTWFGRTDRNIFGNVTTNASTYSVAGTVHVCTNLFGYDSAGIDLLAATNALGVQVSSNRYNAFHQVLTNFNALNEATVNTYDSTQRLTSVTGPSGLVSTNLFGSDNFLSSTYDYAVVGGSTVYYRTNSLTWASALVATQTDPRGLTITKTWDALARLRRVDYPDGTFVTNIYDKLDLVRVVDRMGFTNSYGYDSMRRRTSWTNALGYYTIWNYCSCGSLDSVQDRMGNLTYYFYDNQGRRTNSVFGDGYALTNQFNLIGQTTNVTDSGSASTTNWFNNQGLITSVNNAAGQMRATTFDALDRPTNTVDANAVTVVSTFDSLDRLVSRSYADGGVENWTYTAGFAGATGYTNQVGNTVIYGFDPLNRMTNQQFVGVSTQSFAYSSASDLLTLTDGKGQLTSWNYTTEGLVSNKVDATSTVILVYAYDPGQRLTNRWSKARGNTRYLWGARNLTNIAYPASGSITYKFDALDRLTNMVDSVGTTVYSYTAVGQLLSEDGPFASDTVTNGYLNRLRTALSLQQPTGFWTNGFIWDGARRMTNVTSQAGAFAYTLGGAGSASPLTKKILLPNTAYITNVFDAEARLLSTALEHSGDTVLDSYAYIYNPANQRTNLTRRDTSTVAYSYDGAGELTIADSSANAEDRGYLYDAAFNLDTRTNNGVTGAFKVDTLNQLTNAPSPAVNQTYDANGNLVTSHSGKVALVYDDENQLIQWFQYQSGSTCLLNGDLRTDFVYDGLRRLRKRVEYMYETNSSSSSSSQSGGGAPPPSGGGGGSCNLGGWTNISVTEYIYDGKRVIQERDSNNTPTVSYTRGPDLSRSLEGAGGIGGLLARSSGYSGGNWGTHYFYFCDGGGNVTYMLDSSQGSAATYRYDPYGNIVSKSGVIADANVYRFSSKEIHINSGMYYYLYRFYDTNPQRWINRDPVEEEGGLNLYVYVGNEPIGYVDSLGLGRVCLIKYLLVTSYNDKGPGSDSSHFGKSGSVGPGTVAVANYSSQKKKPTRPATPYYEYGSSVTVYDPSGKVVYTGEVHDTGAGWDSRHHNVPPGDWIDIWLPGKEARRFGKQKLKVRICYDDPCAKTDEVIDLTDPSP